MIYWKFKYSRTQRALAVGVSVDILMNPYKGKDCDSSGSEDIKSKDGLSAERIICKIMKPDKYKEIVSGKKGDWDWNNDDAAYDLFSSIWRDMWGIW